MEILSSSPGRWTALATFASLSPHQAGVWHELRSALYPEIRFLGLEEGVISIWGSVRDDGKAELAGGQYLSRPLAADSAGKIRVIHKDIPGNGG